MTGISVVNREEERKLFIDLVEGGQGAQLHICAAVLTQERGLLTLVNGDYCDIPGSYWFGEDPDLEKLSIKSLSQVFPCSKGRVLGWKIRDISLFSDIVKETAASKGLLVSPEEIELFHWNMNSLPLTRLFVNGKLVGKVIPVFSGKDASQKCLNGLVFVYEASLKGLEYVSPENNGKWEVLSRPKGRTSAEARAIFSMFGDDTDKKDGNRQGGFIGVRGYHMSTLW
jgi:hypothetical protein